MPDQVERKSSLLLTLLPLVVLAALVFAGWRMVVNKADNDANTAIPSGQTETAVSEEAGGNVAE